MTDFKGSNGWVEKFRKINNIYFKSVCGEAAIVDEEAVNNWKAKILEIIANYAECDIFNADKRDYILEFYLIKPWRSKMKHVVEEK